MALHYTFEAIGTMWSISIDQAVSPVQGEQLFSRITSRIALFDKTYSRFRADSLVSTMAKAADTYTLPDDAEPLISLYQKLYALTEGHMTPIVGKLMEEIGYDAKYSFVPASVITSPISWQEAIEFQPPHTLVVHTPTLLDFGAAGKGYLVDLVATEIRNFGIDAFYVDAGGDMLQYGTAPLRVALEDPHDPQKAIGIASIQNTALCASSGSRRRWGGYHHIMNPFSKRSVEEIAAVWVVAEHALLADGLATALFFVPPERLLVHFDFTYLIMNRDRSVLMSKNFPAEVFETYE